MADGTREARGNGAGQFVEIAHKRFVARIYVAARRRAHCRHVLIPASPRHPRRPRRRLARARRLLTCEYQRFEETYTTQTQSAPYTVTNA